MWLKLKEYESWACRRAEHHDIFRKGQVKELAGRRKNNIKVFFSETAFKNVVPIPLSQGKTQTLKYVRTTQNI